MFCFGDNPALGEFFVERPTVFYAVYYNLKVSALEDSPVMHIAVRVDSDVPMGCSNHSSDDFALVLFSENIAKHLP